MPTNPYIHHPPLPPLSQIEVLNAATGKTYFFACNAWLKKEGSDTSALRKELLVGSADSAGGEGGGGRSDRGTEGGSALRKELLVGSADTAGGEGREGLFGLHACSDWAAGRVTPNCSVVVLHSCLPLHHAYRPCPLQNPSPLPLSLACAGPTNYRIEVVTSDVRGAGTDADVSIVIYGEKVPAVLRRYNLGR